LQVTLATAQGCNVGWLNLTVAVRKPDFVYSGKLEPVSLNSSQISRYSHPETKIKLAREKFNSFLLNLETFYFFYYRIQTLILVISAKYLHPF